MSGSTASGTSQVDRESIWSVPKNAQRAFLVLFSIQVVASAVFVGIASFRGDGLSDHWTIGRVAESGFVFLTRLSGVVIASAAVAIVLVEGSVLLWSFVTKPLKRRIIIVLEILKGKGTKL